MTEEFPINYDSDAIEKKWRKRWSGMDIYAYDPDSDSPVYSIDTPPPYVSGDLHVGHAMSYTQAEFIARFKRMQGFNVFYPMGFDDNGLPTERYVERKLDVDKHRLGRREFIERCKDVTEEGRQNYRDIWNLLGVSVDWSLLYTTIDDRSQEVSQRSFLDLYDKDRIYRKEDPVIWCPECRTGLAQADLEDEDEGSFLNHIRFPFASEEGFVEISTTRPELIPACVAVFVHPDDERYEDLVGKEVEVPTTGRTVEISTDHKVDQEFGSGAVMVCTFGDRTDIEWWKDHDLDLRIVLNEDGTLNEDAGNYAGMTIDEARETIIDDLDDEGLLIEQESIEHAVQVHERCDTPVEYYLANQWFVKMLDLKDELQERAKDVDWFPEFMRDRFDDWTQGLKWDWCVSRQRFYGVPFPVWYCAGCDEPVFAAEDNLPVDPEEDDPAIDECPSCGSGEFKAETDVMDTWFTSSLTPLINAKWGMDDDRMNVYPMQLRPQGYDIIRTWAFYTMLKSHLHTSSIPWEDIMISGMGMAEEGVSFSKSKGIVVKPRKIIDKYSADALRWWSSKVKLGEDLVFREDDLVAGEKLVTKLWNVARFLDGFLDEKPRRGDLTVMDRWLLQRLDRTVEEATEWFERYEYDRSKELAKQFFWHDMADNYLEIVKQRLYEKDDPSALYVLYHSFLNTLKLLAPILPFVTEEIYHRLYKEFEGEESIHVADWPEVEGYGFEDAVEEGDRAVEVIGALRKYKSDHNIPLNRELDSVTVFGGELGEARQHVKEAMHVNELQVLEEQPDVKEEIDGISLAYEVLGPKYGGKVKQIEKAVSDPSSIDIQDGELLLDVDGEEVRLKEGEDFEASRRFTLEGEEGELVQTDSFVVLVG